MAVSDTVKALAVLGTLVVLFLFYRQVRDDLGNLTDPFSGLLGGGSAGDKDVLTEEEVQAELDSLEESSPDEDTQTNSHEQVLSNIEDTASTLIEERELVQKQIGDAQDRKETVKDQINEERSKLQDKQDMAEEACNFNPDTSWTSLSISTLVAHELGESTECKKLQNQVALHKKTIEEMEEAVDYWNERIARLENRLADLNQQIQNLGEKIGIAHSTGDETVTVEGFNHGSEPVEVYAGVSIRDEHGQLQDYDLRKIRLPATGSSSTTFDIAFNTEEYRASLWPTDSPEEGQDRLADTGWLTYVPPGTDDGTSDGSTDDGTSDDSTDDSTTVLGPTEGWRIEVTRGSLGDLKVRVFNDAEQDRSIRLGLSTALGSSSEPITQDDVEYSNDLQVDVPAQDSYRVDFPVSHDYYRASLWESDSFENRVEDTGWQEGGY